MKSASGAASAAPLFIHVANINASASAKLNTVDIASLGLVKFGFGLSKGGMHTWVFSKGKVYDVHWDKVGANLYEATLLKNFHWLSGAIVIPPDQAIYLANSEKLKRGT